MNLRDRYNPDRDVSPAFLGRVASWLERSGEVLVILRYLRAAGRKDYALCRDASEFHDLVRSAPLGTDIEVFKEPQLPMRGVVDGAFIELASRSASEWSEYLLISDETRVESRVAQKAILDDSPEELRANLAEMMGTKVALGPCPDFNLPDHEGLISRSKGGIDGPR